MSRYKVQFRPQGVLPQDVNLGIHLSDAGVPGVAGCSASCEGWAVLVNDVPSTGDVNHFVDTAVTFAVRLLGGELCGGCLTWELRKLSFDSSDAQFDDFVVTPDGCDGATVVGAGSLSYAGLWLGLYPLLDEKPFCAPILFRQFDPCVTTIGPGATNTYFQLDSTPEGDVLGPLFGTDGLVDAPLNGSRLPPRFRLAGTQICPGTTVTFNLVQDSGTTGNGERINEITGLPSGVWELVFDFLTDVTGASYTVTPTVDGIDKPDQAITFSQDVSQGP